MLKINGSLRNGMPFWEVIHLDSPELNTGMVGNSPVITLCFNECRSSDIIKNTEWLKQGNDEWLIDLGKLKSYFFENEEANGSAASELLVYDPWLHGTVSAESSFEKLMSWNNSEDFYYYTVVTLSATLCYKQPIGNGTNNTIFSSCFISYSSRDAVFAKRLHNDLTLRGIKCWFAPKDIKIGDKFRQKIDDSIKLHDKILLVLSINSINSKWVEKEVETAFEDEVINNKYKLFPISIDQAIHETDKAWAADIRRTCHIGDFSKWNDEKCYQDNLQLLVSQLQKQEESSIREG